MDDDTVGQTISGSTGSPTFQDNVCNMIIVITNFDIHDCRFSYASAGIFEYFTSGASINITNCQFMNEDVAVQGANVGLYNVLIGCTSNIVSQITNSDDAQEAQIYVEGTNLTAENVTADRGYAFIEADNSSAKLTLTNCLVTDQPLLSPYGYALTPLSNDVVCLPSPSTPVYQIVGAGNYYLTNNSPYRNAGTTNIDPNLLAELAERTTYPPLLYSNTAISVVTSLSPAVQRDNVGAPDLGYHYDPFDYVFGGSDLYSNLTFTAGTAVGFFQGYGGVYLSGQPYGISLNNGANLSFNGNATEPCYFANYSMVQEGGNGYWTTSGYMGGIIFNGSSTNLCPQLTGDFTKLTLGALSPCFFRDNWAYGACGFFNCEFYDGQFGTFLISAAYFTNCLFFRDLAAFWDQDYAASFFFEIARFIMVV